jgi:hypothetical protein
MLPSNAAVARSSSTRNKVRHSDQFKRVHLGRILDRNFVAGGRFMWCANSALDGDWAMQVIHDSLTAARWNDALAHMEQALSILDHADAPPEIGGHLDLAVTRLQEALHGKAPASVVEKLRGELERLLDEIEPSESGFA